MRPAASAEPLRAPRPRSAPAASRSDGPELSTSRRRGVRGRQIAATRSGEERLPASAGTGCRRSRAPRSARPSRPTPARASRSRHPWRRRPRSSAISTGSRSGIGRPPAHPGIASSRSHWFTTECRGRSSRARWHDPRVHPAAALDVVADPLARAARPASATRCAGRRADRSPGRTAPAAAVAPARRSSSEPAQPRASAARRSLRRGAGCSLTTRRRRRLDEIRRCARRDTPAAARRMTGVVNTTSPIRRSRSSRIFTRWLVKMAMLELDRGFVDEHDRDVVLDRIDALALRALERRAVLHEIDLRLAVRARQNLEQLRIDASAVPTSLGLWSAGQSRWTYMSNHTFASVAVLPSL